MKFRRLIFANLFRKKARLVLTLGSFAAALFLFAFLAVVRTAFTGNAQLASAKRLDVINKVSIIQPIPLSYRDKMMTIRGIKAITHDNWFGGVYQDPKNFFPSFVIDPENQREVVPELVVPDDQWKTFLADRQGAIVGAATMKRFHWKIGDKIPLQNTIYGSGTWDFNVDGVYHGTRTGDDETQFWFQWDYFEESVPEDFKGQVGWYIVELDNPADGPRIAKQIDEMFANSPFETKTQTESAFAANWVKQFANIEFLILTIGAVVFFTLLLVTGNTMAISVRERTAELGVLKAIGFTDRAVLMLVLGEALLIALVGGLLGLVFARFVGIPGLAAALAGLLPQLNLSWPDLGAGLVAALLIGAAGGFLPGISAMRLRVVNALRRV